MTDADRRAATIYGELTDLLAEWRAHGVTDAVVSPGSRSTPLTLAADASGLRTWVQLDERSAAFFALGLARARRAPVVLVCTSGTAAANYHPAVVEAHHQGVPLLVCTADRPPALRGWASPQTVDQVGLYGSSVRAFVELPVGGTWPDGFARRAAARALASATGAVPGPVHLNLPVDEPLEPPAAGLPAAPRPGAPAVTRQRPGVGPGEVLATAVTSTARGLIVPGPIDLDDGAVATIAAVAEETGWPILAEPGSQLRSGPHVTRAPVVAHGVELARALAGRPDLQPELVVRFGLMPTSKPIRQWLTAARPRQILVGPGAEWADPTFTATAVVDGPVGAVFDAARSTGHPGAASDPAWTTAWLAADRLVDEAKRPVLDGGPFAGPHVAARLGRLLPAGAGLFASNSLPIRDVDEHLPIRSEALTVLTNRGANGIDGIVSTALGAAAGGVDPMVLLTGDLALLHDLGGLLAADRLGVRLVVVVIDNDGGGIFSQLPLADRRHEVAFDRLFHTPHGLDLVALVRGAGLAATSVTSPDGFDTALRAALDRPTTSVIHVPVDPGDELDLHRRLRRAAATALDG